MSESVARKTPLVLIPGTLCDAALWRHQIDHLGDIADVSVADHTKHDSIAAIARFILAAAPPRFALAGLSMGGFVAFEIMRQAPERVMRLALFDTSARADPPEMIQRRSDLTRGARKGDAQGAIYDGNTLVDRGARQLGFLAGLESHIVEQCRFGERTRADLISMVNTLPPPEKVQQLVRVGSQSCVGQAAQGFVIEILVDPFDLTAGQLLDNAVRAAHMVVGWLGNYAERHHRAASSKDWN